MPYLSFSSTFFHLSAKLEFPQLHCLRVVAAFCSRLDYKVTLTLEESSQTTWLLLKLASRCCVVVLIHEPKAWSQTWWAHCHVMTWCCKKCAENSWTLENQGDQWPLSNVKHCCFSTCTPKRFHIRCCFQREYCLFYAVNWSFNAILFINWWFIKQMMSDQFCCLLAAFQLHMYCEFNQRVVL